MLDNAFVKVILGLLTGVAALLAWGGFLWLIMELPKKIKARKQKQEKVAYDLVSSHSSKYQQLLELVSTCPVVSIPETFRVEHAYKSKQGMENAKAKEVIILLANEKPELKKLYDDLGKNRKHRKEFLAAVSLISETQEAMIVSTGLQKSRFLEIENNLFQALVDSIREDVAVEIKLCYRTPKGTYLYSRTLRTDYQGLADAYAETGRRQAAKVARDIERSKLSASLRYDVMRRDGFKCKLCGTTAANGAVLHVDHIIPVSKGGKTEMSNLRTLCDLCNLGKSDKYESSGLN